jgi:hypothetical protein
MEVCEGLYINSAGMSMAENQLFLVEYDGTVAVIEIIQMKKC